MTPTKEQLEGYISAAERMLQGPDAQGWMAWCAEALRSAWETARALDELGQKFKDGLFGKR
jgi:hypothetical protein